VKNSTRPHHIDDILSRLSDVKQYGSNISADCPVPKHQTSAGYLSVKDDGDKALVTCQGGRHDLSSPRDFQQQLLNELACRGCPLPAPLADRTVFPRAVRGRATLVHWRRGDSAVEDWVLALGQPHGWCIEIPEGVFFLDLDRGGDRTLHLLASRLPVGYGLVQSSQGRYHIWVNGEASPGQHIGRLDGSQELVEVHGSGRLATLPPSLHVGTGRPYSWLRRFLGTASVTPEALGIAVDLPPPRPRRRVSLPGPTLGVSLSELMAQYVGQEGRRQGREVAFFCPRHEDRRRRSLMVEDELGLFYCHGAGCGWSGNRVTLERLLGLRSSGRRLIPTFGVRNDQS